MDAVQVAAREDHTLFLRSNGSVYSCGNGFYGQLGLGDQFNRMIPTQIQNIIGTQVAVGTQHSFIVTSNGLFSFGIGSAGQLGNGDSDLRLTPTLVAYTSFFYRVLVTL
jgi:alpha-tubulin suppressor-like RCC1 family protein